MKGSSLVGLCHSLGIIPSCSRPGVSDDNPGLEALFRNTKYWPGSPYGGFVSMEQARKWIYDFVFYYNNHYRHSELKFVTPSQMHTGEGVSILAERKALYERAKSQRPNRWIGDKTRDWSPTGDTWITPPSLEMLQKRNSA